MAKNLGYFALGLYALPLIGCAAIVVSRVVLVMSNATASIATDPGKPAISQQTDTNLIHMRPGDSKEYSWLTVIKPDEIFKRRRVRISAYLNFSDIAGPEYRTASPGDQRIFANLFAPNVAREECERIRQVFAARCEVDNATAEVRQPGRFSVEMTLLFTSKEPFGAFTAADAATYQETRVPLSLNGGANSMIAFSQQTSERQALYRLAASSCESYKRSNGNCAIGDIEILAKPFGNSSDVLRLEAVATLLTLRGKDSVAKARQAGPGFGK